MEGRLNHIETEISSLLRWAVGLGMWVTVMMIPIIGSWV